MIQAWWCWRKGWNGRAPMGFSPARVPSLPSWRLSAVLTALQEAGHSTGPLYNQKRHFKLTFSPKLFRKETNLSHQQVGAPGFQPAPRTVFVRLHHDSSFLSRRGPVVFLQDTGLLNSKAEYANYLQPHAQSPQTFFSGKVLIMANYELTCQTLKFETL